MGELKIVAEDLGIITQDVEDLRDHLIFRYEGTAICLDGSKPNTHLPHYHNHNSVVYTGTTITTPQNRGLRLMMKIQKYIFGIHNSKFNEAVWSMIRLAWSSVAQTAIAPIQDF